MTLNNFLDRRTVLTAGGALMFGATLSPWGPRAQTSGGKLPIGTIGAGHIGSTIGGLWIKNGHKVLFSSRHPEEFKDLVAGFRPIGGLWIKNGHKVLFSSRHPEELKDLVAGLGPLAQAGTVDQAIAFGEVVLLTVPYGALPQIGREHAAQLKGKIVL